MRIRCERLPGTSTSYLLPPSSANHSSSTCTLPVSSLLLGTGTSVQLSCTHSFIRPKYASGLMNSSIS